MLLIKALSSSPLVYVSAPLGPVLLCRIQAQVAYVVVPPIAVVVKYLELFLMLVVRRYAVVEPYVYDPMQRKARRRPMLLVAVGDAYLHIAGHAYFALRVKRPVRHRLAQKPFLKLV